MTSSGPTPIVEYPISALDTGELTETPNPAATRPTGMCGSPSKCERCPSDFLCVTKAKAEAEIIRQRSECASCGEGSPKGECPKSQRACGHHCNHSWTHDSCDWCGFEFSETAAGR